MLLVRLYHVTIPMNRPFSHSQHERKAAESVILSIKYREITGIGECVPREYVTGETIESVINNIMSINFNHLVGSINFSTINDAINSLNANEIINRLVNSKALNAVCVIEMALLDIIGQNFNLSINEILKRFYIPKPLVETIDLKVIRTAQVMDFSLNAYDFIKDRGPFYTVKIKVGHEIRDDMNKLEYIRSTLGNSILIILDPNMAWNFKEAIKNMKDLNKFNISYYEEPLMEADRNQYRNLKLETGSKILLDESLCTIFDAEEAINKKSCDAFNIRLSKCGGFKQSAELLKIAQENKIDFQIGAQVAETGPLIAAARHFAGAVSGYFAFEAGQADRYFNEYIIDPMPLVDRISNTALPILKPGLGVTLNGTVNRFSVSQTDLLN